MSVGTAVVVGGGIGGLTAGVALARRGWEVSVWEAADSLRPVGAGIAVPPNAMRALESLGLADTVSTRGMRLGASELADAEGRTLSRIDLADGFGAASVAIRRSALVDILAGALPEGALHTGARCVGATSHGERVRAVFADGREATGDLLIGADGIRSVVRERVGPEARQIYSGQTCYRGIAAFALPDPSLMRELWGGRRRFGWVAVDGGAVYWYAVETAPAGGAPASRPDLERAFANFADPVAALIAATPDAAVVHTDLWELEAPTRWHAGRIALVGDAAHAMTPNLGQGGAQAIEDATLLAALLERHDAPEAALRAWERCRRPRVRWIVDTARRLGRLAHWEHPAARRLRDTAMRAAPNALQRKPLQRLFTPGVPEA